MLNKFISKNLKYFQLFQRTQLISSVFNINFKTFAKKDKGRLSDSDSKRGAKARNTENSETIEFSSSSDNTGTVESNTPTNRKEIQTVEGHKVFTTF